MSQPKWWGLFDVKDPDHPEPVAWSQDKQELIDLARKEPADRPLMLEWFDYDPQGFVLHREFEANQDAQIKALNILLGEVEE